MIDAVMLTATILLLISTLLPLSNYEAWWVRGWDFPRLILVTVSLIFCGAGFFLLDLSNKFVWLIITTNFVCMVYHLTWIIPYTRLYPKQVQDAVTHDRSQTIRLMVANVLQTNPCYNELLEIIKNTDPHIFVTLETNQVWQDHLDQLQGDYPYAVKCPLENLYGMHVYSKLPLKDAELSFLVMKDIPSIHTHITLPSGKEVSLHFMHPRPPAPSESGESTQRDIELLVVGKSLVKQENAVIVSGDLNDVAWSRTTKLFLKISHLLDPRVGRGMFNTFHAKHWFLRWPLDHFFHSDHFTLSKLERLPYFGSDHFPVLIELVYDESQRKKQKVPVADASDKKLAQEKIQHQHQ